MKRKRKKKRDILGTVLIQFKHVLFIHVLQCLPIAKLSSFCILELTPAILYKPCSSIPEGGDKRSSVNVEPNKNQAFLPFKCCTLAALKCF